MYLNLFGLFNYGAADTLFAASTRPLRLINLNRLRALRYNRCRGFTACPIKEWPASHITSRNGISVRCRPV